jgi:hypothetical protein
LCAVALACGGKSAATSDAGPIGTDGNGGLEGSPGDDGGPRPTADGGPGTIEGGAVDIEAGPTPLANKVDVLFMIDNSASMGDKQALFAQAIPDFIDGLVKLQVQDMHIGIVTSSLGGRGGDQCPTNATNPANTALSAHADDRGELINRGGTAGNPLVENPVSDILPSNYLGWFPSVSTNAGHMPPTGTAITDSATLIADFTAMVEGVHEHGCGFEAQNEAWYRFLVQPDPFSAIVKDASGSTAQVSGIDQTILQQRHDFLRADSVLAVVVVTDENEEVADPLAVQGQGWAFTTASFPGSPNGAAPEGSIECTKLDPNNPLATGPNDPKCSSCALLRNDPSYSTRCPQDGLDGRNGYLDPADDTLNTRFFQQKRRFGVFTGYPTSRYVRGLQQRSVPDSQHEHDAMGNYVGDQDASAHCVNPIYAQNLPIDPSGGLCTLTPGPRDPRQVFYMAIAGVPHQLLQGTPGDSTCPAGTDPADCPQKDTLSAADWTLIMGQDPEHYDFRGADFHMIEDWNPRTGAAPLTESPWQAPGVLATLSKCAPDAQGHVQGVGCDPINGGEWAPNKQDLQFACIFDLRPLYDGVGKDCTSAMYQGACDCAANSLNSGTQLCDPTTKTLQIYGKAYPSVREMIIAHAVGDQGMVSSLCPIHITDNAAGNDPLYGYRPALLTLVDRIGKIVTQ